MPKFADYLNAASVEIPRALDRYDERERERYYRAQKRKEDIQQELVARGYLGEGLPGDVDVTRESLIGKLLEGVGILGDERRPLDATEKLAYEQGTLAREDVGYKKSERKRKEFEDLMEDQSRNSIMLARNAAVLRSYQEMVENGLNPVDVAGVAQQTGGEEHSKLVEGIDFSGPYDTYLNRRDKENKTKGPKEKTFEDIMRAAETDKYLITLRKQIASIQAEMIKPENSEAANPQAAADLKNKLDTATSELRNRYAYHFNRFKGEKALEGMDTGQLADFAVGGPPPGSTIPGGGGGPQEPIPVVDPIDAVQSQLENPPSVANKLLRLLANPAAPFGAGGYTPRGMPLNAAGGMGPAQGMPEYTEQEQMPQYAEQSAPGGPPIVDFIASLLGNEPTANAGVRRVGPSDLANKQDLEGLLAGTSQAGISTPGPRGFRKIGYPENAQTPWPKGPNPKGTVGPEFRGGIVDHLMSEFQEAKSEEELMQMIQTVIDRGIATKEDVEQALLKVGTFNLGAVGGGGL